MMNDPRTAAAGMLSQRLRGLNMEGLEKEYSEKKQPLPEETEDPTMADEYSDVSPMQEEEPIPPEVLEFIQRLM